MVQTKDETVTSVMDFLDQLVNDRLIVRTGKELLQVPEISMMLNVDNEVKAWKQFRAWNDVISPKCKFSGTIANKHERRRRYTLFSMFRLFSFWGTGDEVRDLFVGGVGQLSILWFAESVGTRAPPHYYEWMMDSLPKPLNNWGPTFIAQLMNSSSHMKMMRKRNPKAVDRAVVRMIENVCTQAAANGVPPHSIERACGRAMLSIRNSVVRDVQKS